MDIGSVEVAAQKEETGALEGMSKKIEELANVANQLAQANENSFDLTSKWATTSCKHA